MLRPALVLLAVALLAPTAPAQNAGTNPLVQGLSIAQAQVPGGILIRSRLEYKGKLPVQGYYFWLEGKVVEIELSQDFQVIKNTQKDPVPVTQDVVKMIEKQTKGKAKLPDGRLLEIAIKALKDAPQGDLKYDIVDGKLVLRVGDIIIDAQTGNIISTKGTK